MFHLQLLIPFAKRKVKIMLIQEFIIIKFPDYNSQTVAGVEGDITAVDITYLSGTGILVALIFAIIVGHLFHYLAW